MAAEHEGDDGAIAAEVLSAAEQQALDNPPPPSPPRSSAEDLERMLAAAVAPIRWPALRFEVDPELIEKARAAQAKLRAHRKRQRAERGQRKRAALFGEPMPANTNAVNPYDAAIERAHARAAELAAKVPERLRTPEQRQAIARMAGKR